MAIAHWQSPWWDREATRRHQKGGPRAKQLWERSIIVAQTAVPDEKSIFDPNLTDADIERIGLPVAQGIVGHALGPDKPNVRKFFHRHESDLGGSNGAKTPFLLVVYNQSGSAHGYPVTEQYLRAKGADL